MFLNGIYPAKLKVSACFQSIHFLTTRGDLNTSIHELFHGPGVRTRAMLGGGNSFGAGHAESNYQDHGVRVVDGHP